MQNYFALAAPEIQNAMVDTSPIGNALDDYRLRQRQAQQDKIVAEERQFNRNRLVKADELTVKERLANQALAYDQLTDPIQRQAGLQRILGEHPNANNLPEAYKNPSTAFKLIAADYGKFRDDLDRQTKILQNKNLETSIAKTQQEIDAEKRKSALVQDIFKDPNQPTIAPQGQPNGNVVPTGSPQNTNQSLSQKIFALPPEKRIAAQGAAEKGDWEGFNKILESEKTLPGGFKDNKQLADVEEGFRKEYAQIAKPYFEVRDAYNRIRASAKIPSAAGDLALIFNYMKILDPGSTVREGEFATAQNAAGVPDVVRSQFNKLLTGERLADNQRTDFIKTAERLAKSQEQQYRKTQQQYEAIAKRKGLDTKNIILDYSALDDEEPKKDLAGSPTSVAGSVIDYLSTGDKPVSEWTDEEIKAHFARGR